MPDRPTQDDTQFITSIRLPASLLRLDCGQVAHRLGYSRRGNQDDIALVEGVGYAEEIVDSR